MRLQPRTRAALAAPAEARRQLRDERERADPAPAMVAREHEEERQRRDGDRPEHATRARGRREPPDNEAREQDERGIPHRLDPPGVQDARSVPAILTWPAGVDGESDWSNVGRRVGYGVGHGLWGRR